MANRKTRQVKGDAKPPAARPRIAAEMLPRRSLRDCVSISQVLHRTYAGKSATWSEIASELEIGKTSTTTKYLFWSAQAYGIINKEEEGQVFSLAETGRKIVAPTYEGEEKEAIRKAILTPTILSKFFSDYAGHPVPSGPHFHNVLETKFGVPRDRTEEAAQIILDNARYAAILHEPADGPMQIDMALPSQLPTAALRDDEAAVAVQPPQEAAPIEWSEICFFVTPIGEDATDIRKHSDMILKHLLEPVAKEFNLKVVRADKIGRSGLINQQVFEHLARSRLCITDMSFNNPNAFYELAVRHMCKLPSIQIIRKGDKIPFDVSQGRTITVDTSDVYTIMDRFESARRELSEHVKNAMAGGASMDDNPVHAYLPTLQITLPK